MKEAINEKDFIAEIADKAAKKFSYGEIVNHSWLSEQFNIKCPERGTKRDFDNYSLKMLKFTDMLKDALLHKHKMMLVSKIGTGYLIVLPKDQSTVAMQSLKISIHKEMVTAARRLENVNHMKLNNSQIQERDNNLGRIAAIAAFSKKSIAV